MRVKDVLDKFDRRLEAIEKVVYRDDIRKHRPLTAEEILSVVVRCEASTPNSADSVVVNRKDLEVLCERVRTLLQMEEYLEMKSDV